MFVRIANKDTDKTSLVWVCIVCLGLFGRQLVFKFLEHLLYILLTQSNGTSTKGQSIRVSHNYPQLNIDHPRLNSRKLKLKQDLKGVKKVRSTIKLCSHYFSYKV